MTRLYFYQAVNANCDTAAGGSRTLPLLTPTGAPVTHGICEYVDGGQAVQSQVKATEIQIEHDTLYDYSVYLADLTKFHIEVRKVADHSCAFCGDVAVEDFFSGDAAQMMARQQPGYITITMQKSMGRDTAGHFFGSITSPNWDLMAIGINWLKMAN